MNLFGKRTKKAQIKRKAEINQKADARIEAECVSQS